MAVTESGGRPVVLGGTFEGVTMWDVSSGQLVGRPLHGDLGEVKVVSFAPADGRLLVVTATDEGAVERNDEDEPEDPCFDVWDAVTGEQVCSFERPDDQPFGYPVHAACVSDGDGDVYAAVVVAEREGPFHAWDLQNFTELRAEGQRHVPAVACACVDGLPVAVTAGDDDLLRMWNSEPFAVGENGDPWPCGSIGQVNALAVGDVDGRAVLVAGGDQVGLWDLATRAPIGQPTALHDTYVTAVAAGRIAGRPVAVSGDFHGTIRVWDLSSGEPWGEPMSSGRWMVSALAVADIGGRSIVASASLHGILSAWELPGDGTAAPTRE